MKNPNMVKQEKIMASGKIKTKMSQMNIFVNYYLIFL